jgi:hypothetical protein
MLFINNCLAVFLYLCRMVNNKILYL